MAALSYLTFGLAISLGLGSILTPKFLDWLRQNLLSAIDAEYHVESFGALDWLVGVIERLFFTIIVGFDVSGAAVAMVSWILVKMATNWHRIIESGDNRQRGLALCSMMGSMVSLFFALVGGLIIRAGMK